MSGWKWLILGCCIGGGFFAIVPSAWERYSIAFAHASGPTGVGEALRRGLPDFTRLVERVGPAVVNVTTRTARRHVEDTADRHYELYRGLTGGDERPKEAVVGIGSGFVLHPDGYILTNAHVVAGADEVFVRLPGRHNEIRALVVGSDDATDIALLKIRAHRLPVVRPGSSRSLKVGDWVAAIGSPFGFDNTITAGIVSAKERRLPQGPETLFLQSDVAINPGSSGGPLVNLNGEVVGINSKIYTRTGGYMGVSFAIPIETAIEVGDALRRAGTTGLAPAAAASHGSGARRAVPATSIPASTLRVVPRPQSLPPTFPAGWALMRFGTEGTRGAGSRSFSAGASMRYASTWPAGSELRNPPAL